MVSIIIPVCNMKEYLQRCFDSVLAQTYGSYEVITVDYGSTDGSDEVCDSYALADSRFRVIRRGDVELGEARNIGIRMAKGDYVAFIDADDYVHPQYLELLIRLIESGDFQFAGCRYIHPEGDMNASLLRTYDLAELQTIEVTGRQLLEGLFFKLPIKGFSFKTVWGGVFRKSVIHEVFFADFPRAEDVDYSSRLYQKIQSAVIADLRLYYWVERNGSRHNSDFSYKSLYRVLSFYQAKENIPESEDLIRALGVERLYLELMYTRDKSTGDMKNRTQKFLLSVHRKNRREMMRNRHIGMLFKLYMFLALPFPGFYAGFHKILKHFEKQRGNAVSKRFVGAKK